MINYKEKQIADTLSDLKKYGFAWVSSFEIAQTVKERSDQPLRVAKCSSIDDYYLSIITEDQ